LKTNTSIRGTIFSIERCAVHDGPGIRTVVFMKGCPLRCSWCANPEGQTIRPQLTFSADKCVGCLKCVSVCAQEAIEVTDGRSIQAWNKCRGCLKCVNVCNYGARQQKGYDCTAEEIVEEISRDIPFYKRSGGGVTLSGGDPVTQVMFSREILGLCQKKDIHTAIETSGYVDWVDFLKILEFTDFIYIDIKCMDTVKHEMLTKSGNERVLENIVRLSELKKPFIVRIPVIAGYNDSNENILDTTEFVKGLKNLVALELLPYHKLGEYKYKSLGMSFSSSDINVPSDENMRYIQSLIENYGIKCIYDTIFL